MNKAQRNLIIIGVAISLFMAAFPPFNFVTSYNSEWHYLGYGFLFSPPESPLGYHAPAQVHYGQLLTQIGAQWLIVSLLFIGLKSGNSNS
jgi:hypothetical protein